MLLEVAVFNINAALAAAANGADRLELCENYANGGTTPSLGILKTVKEKIQVPVNVIIRPRGGDFLYTAYEFEAMKQDIQLCKQLGFDGVVFGILLKDGNIDTERTKELVKLAYPLKVTFHRAFDRCIDPYKGLEDIISCGCHKLLTSGQRSNALAGKELLQKLVTIAGKRIMIMPGGGINSSNIAEIKYTVNAKEYHASCKILMPSEMDFTSNRLHDDNVETGIDVNELKRIKALLQ